MRTFREILLQEAETNHQRNLRLLLEQHWLQNTIDGYRVDVLKLADELSENAKDDLMRYILLRRAEKNDRPKKLSINFSV